MQDWITGIILNLSLSQTFELCRFQDHVGDVLYGKNIIYIWILKKVDKNIYDMYSKQNNLNSLINAVH